MKQNSEKKNSDENVGESSTISKNSDSKVEESTNSGFRENFLKKLDFTNGIESEKKDEKNEDSENQAHEHDPHAFPMIGDFLSSDKLKDLKSGNNKLVMGIGIFAGALLIFAGIITLMTNSPEQVADNVIFGERAEFSVFLILAGILVIAGVFARKFLDKSFFKGINKEFESHNGTSSNSTKKEYKKG